MAIALRKDEFAIEFRSQKPYINQQSSKNVTLLFDSFFFYRKLLCQINPHIVIRLAQAAVTLILT
ncbi:hypothetical protein [Desulfobacter vibrioformis]|uniref:hypothetical protein n=1 Tax=Desulfobacter vibrioformis TaxID=34031 RepID=UPI0012EBF0CE|nr:hypothetical protein [Desulfobacter vibrioformis]